MHGCVTGTRALVLPNGRYAPSELGAFSYRLAVIEDGQIVGWNPNTDEVATCFGVGWALGQDQILAGGLGSTGLPVPVHRSPLGWLRNNRFGVVILDYRRAAHRLADLSVESEDDHHQGDLDRLLRVPLARVLSATRRMGGLT
jgi:hypothetical protein